MARTLPAPLLAVLLAGAGVAVVGFGTAIGVTLYNNRWIDEYNTLAQSFEFYRTRDPGRAAEYQAQGREHLRVIQQNETLAVVSAVVGGVGTAVALGTLLFWPRESVRVPRAASLEVAPTLNGLSLRGTF